MDYTPVVKDLAGQTLTMLKSELGAAYDGFTDEEKALVTRCTFRAAQIKLAALVDPTVGELDQKLVNAQLANIKVAGQATMVNTFWTVVDKVLSIAGPILVKALVGAIL